MSHGPDPLEPEQDAPPPVRTLVLKKTSWPVVWLALAAIVAGFVGCAALIGVIGQDAEESLSQMDDDVAERRAQEEERASAGVPLGDRADADGIGFTVADVRDGVPAVGADPETEAFGQFVIVTVQLDNPTQSPWSYQAGGEQIIDDRGREFAVRPVAGIDQAATYDVPAAGSASVEVLFDIPRDAAPARVRLLQTTDGWSVDLRLAEG